MTARTREWMHERARQKTPWYGQDMVDLVDTLYHRHEQLPVRLDAESTRQVVKDIGKALGVGTTGTFVTPKDLQDAIGAIEVYKFPGLPENHVAIGDGLNKPLKSTPRFTTVPDGEKVHVKIDDDILLGGDIKTGYDGFTIWLQGTDVMKFGPDIINMRRTVVLGGDPTEDAGGEGYDFVVWGDTFLKNSQLKPELPLFKSADTGLLYSRRLEETDSPWTRGASVAAGTIMIGDPVAATGQDFGVLAMNTALAATPARSWMLGVSAEGGYPGEISGFVRRGPVEFDTQAFTGAAGSQLWLQPAGGLNTTKPTVSNATRNVTAGTLLVKAEAGKIYVDPVNFPFVHELSGVSADAPADKQVLMYDAPSNRWISSAISGAGLEPTITPGNSSQVWLGTKTWGQVADAQVASGAAIAWSKISKVGAVPGDVGAAPAFTSSSAGQVFATPAAASGVPGLRLLVASDLPNSGVTPGGIGSATAIPVLTIDAKGRITAASSVTVTPAWADITGKPAVIGTVTSVGLSAPALMTASGSPVTGAGTLSLAWNGSSTNLVLADGTTIPSSTFVTGGPYHPLENQRLSTGDNPTFASAAIGGGVIRRHALYPSTQGAIYGSGVTPGDANYSLLWTTNGDAAVLAGSTSVFLRAGGSDRLWATSSGVRLYGTTTLDIALNGLLKATSGVVSVASSADLPGGPFLPLAAGAGSPLTSDLYFTNSATALRGIRGTMGGDDNWRVVGGATAANTGFLEIATADDGNEPIYVRQYTGAFATASRTLTLLDGNGNSVFPGSITAGNAQMSAWSGNPVVHARFGHQDWNVGGGFGYLQASDGEVYLEAPTGHNIHLRISGPDVVLVNSSGAQVTGTLSASGSLAWGGGGAIGSSGHVVHGVNGTRSTNSGSWTSVLPSGFYDNDAAGNTPSGGWCYMINTSHTGSGPGNQYQAQLATNLWGDNMWFRRITNGSVGAWRELWHSGNMDNDGPWLPLTGMKNVTGYINMFADLYMNTGTRIKAPGWYTEDFGIFPTGGAFSFAGGATVAFSGSITVDKKIILPAAGAEASNVAPSGFSRVTVTTSGTTLLPAPEAGLILIVQRTGTAPSSYYVKPANGHIVSYVDLGGVARIMNNSATNGLTLSAVGGSLMFIGVSSTQWSLIGAWPQGF